MALQATQRNEERRLRSKLLKDKATYQTQLSRKETALRISTDTNASPERRAEAQADYKRLVKEIKTLQDSMSATERSITKEKTRKELTNYDEKKGKEKAKALEEKYTLLADDYAISKDPSVKAQLDKVVKEYKSVYDSVIGQPISRAAAYSKLNKTATTFAGGTATGTTTLTKTAEDTTTKSKLVKDKVTGETPAKTPKGTVFTQPMTIAGQVDTTAGDAEKKSAGLGAAAALDLAGTLFEHVPSLKTLLDNYVKQGWSNTRFLQELRNDTWYKKNSAEIKTRYIQLYNYQDMIASGQAEGNTEYEKQIRKLKEQITKKARDMGSGLASDPAAIQRVAENMYITNTEIDDSFTTNLIAAAIRPIGSTIAGKPTEGYSGQALLDYKTIQDAARNNGFSVADIIPGGANEQQILQGIATGAIDINRIKQDARRLAAQGQPQYVRDLLGQGFDLDQIYAPYRQTMANILEIGDPAQIDLNDQTLRMAITDKGDMNLYDFKKALRQDTRWQYTGAAKEEVSNSALKVLRDFGFQG